MVDPSEHPGSVPSPSLDYVWEEVFDAAPMAYAILGGDGVVIRENRTHRALFRRTGAAAGRDGSPVYWVGHTKTDDRASDSLGMAEVRSGAAEVFEGHTRFERADGTAFWGRYRLTPLRSSDRSVVATLGAISETSGGLGASETMPSSERLLHALVEHAVDAVIVVDVDATVVFASPGAERLAGFRDGGWVGRSALELIDERDVAAVATSFANTSRTPGDALPLRFRIRRTDGEARAVEAVATNLLEDPSVRGIVVNIHDLTDRQDAVTALQASEHRYRRLLENISDTVTVIDAQGGVIDTTGNVKRILGYDTNFWSSRSLFDIIHPDDMGMMQQRFLEVVAVPGSEAIAEVRVRMADGTFAFVEGHAVNMLDDADVRAVVLTTRNISDRKRGELELAAARDAAVRSLELRTEFVANVSHELRTPIHGVLGLAELLGSADLDPDSAILVQSIRRAADALSGVLDDVLDFAKIEGGHIELEIRPTMLPDLVDDVMGLLHAQAIAKGLELEVRIDPHLPVRIDTDPLRLRQVLTNLVANAVKFTAVGSVRVTMSKVGVAQWSMAVVDTGIGISSATAAQIFEPFNQAHRSTAREYGGTGLGLTICRRLVELMGGTLAVASVVGSGTTFTALLPLVGTTERAPAGEAGALRGRTPGRVLVVEDNPVNQLLVTRQLERLGYESTLAPSGQEALAQLEAQDGAPYTVVLMDWRMPGLDGLAATELLRRSEHRRGVAALPVVGMTASVLPGDRQRCLDAGMDDVIAKPVSLAMLGRTLARWTTRPSPADHRGPAGTPAAAGVVEPEAPFDVPIQSTLGGPELSAPEDREVVDRGEVVHLPVVRRLIDELEDSMLVANVVRSYLRELPGRVEQIEDAAREGDRDQLRLAAHTLASTSAAVGAIPLADVCRVLERDAQADDAPLDSIETVLSKLARLRDGVTHTMSALLTDLESSA